MNEATAPDPCAEQTTISGPRDLVGLALSGGGYRATLFHLGALIRLNELGWLASVARFSGVSGGSIALGALAAGWAQLTFDRGSATNFDQQVVAPLLRFTEGRLDVWAALYGAAPRLQSAELLARFYRRLVGDRTLQDLPDAPQFIFNATNLQTGVALRFTKRYLRDYRAGCLPYPRLTLAEAIAASSAFPPYLSPNIIRLPAPGLRATSDPALHDRRFQTRLVVSDGGVYDNLGLQTLASFRTVLVSDGGSPGAVDPAPRSFFQMLRVLNVMQEQNRALRRHELVEDLRTGRKRGAIWTVKTDQRKYPPPDGPRLLSVDPSWVARLATVPTRLWPYGQDLTRRLVNWGYAAADGGMRSWLRVTGSAPAWPFPDEELGSPITGAGNVIASDGLD
jgi:NTE family protein